MARARLPLSMATSLVLHAGAFWAYLNILHLAPKNTSRVIGNVDLYIQARQGPAQSPAPRAAEDPSTWNFLKLALPAVPRAEPQALEVKVPELRRPQQLAQPKLDDGAPRSGLPKIAKLDLGQRKADVAKFEVSSPVRRAQALAALPRLEDVGARRVKNLPQALLLEERRREAAQTATLAALNVPTHAHVSAAPILREAEIPESSSVSRKLKSLLPSEDPRFNLPAEIRPAPENIARKLDKFVAPPLEKRDQAAALGESKKGVEIEGPLKDRRVVAYDLPPFPDWAKRQGILEASVSIRFNVSSAGDVLPSMRLENSSGYGRLDRLVMESLKNWKFEPLLGEANQWGVITFRFVLE